MLATATWLRPEDIVVNVGVNIGKITLNAAYWFGQFRRVLVIESPPRIYRYLTETISELRPQKPKQSGHDALRCREIIERRDFQCL
jgi:hypothetical protein